MRRRFEDDRDEVVARQRVERDPCEAVGVRPLERGQPGCEGVGAGSLDQRLWPDAAHDEQARADELAGVSEEADERRIRPLRVVHHEHDRHDGAERPDARGQLRRQLSSSFVGVDDPVGLEILALRPPVSTPAPQRPPLLRGVDRCARVDHAEQIEQGIDGEGHVLPALRSADDLGLDRRCVCFELRGCGLERLHRAPHVGDMAVDRPPQPRQRRSAWRHERLWGDALPSGQEVLVVVDHDRRPVRHGRLPLASQGCVELLDDPCLAHPERRLEGHHDRAFAGAHGVESADQEIGGARAMCSDEPRHPAILPGHQRRCGRRQCRAPGIEVESAGRSRRTSWSPSEPGRLRLRSRLAGVAPVVVRAGAFAAGCVLEGCAPCPDREIRAIRHDACARRRALEGGGLWVWVGFAR
ncbi:MAG TPA: hypothetical protein VHK88_01605 [Aquihabitans sp.]|nr:hypothetical protein [Aquihabitans sp.]